MDTSSQKGARGLRVGVIGSGAAGMYAASRLSPRHEVTLFEADDRPGGHAHSVTVAEGVTLDSAFIIFNTHAYPRFYAWLDALGVRAKVRDAEMSMTFFDRGEDFYFVGRAGLSGVFAQPHNALRPWFWRLLLEMRRFKREAYADWLTGTVEEVSLSRYAADRGYSEDFTRHFLYPMAAAVWSLAGPDVAEMSAATLLRFLGHHAMLKAQGARWQTLRGGSVAYVDAFRNTFEGDLRLSTRVERVVRRPGGVDVFTRGAAAVSFDHVVVATHADVALSLLEAPTDEERRLLSPWRYAEARTLLHTDASLLPPRQRAWSSWNITTERARRAVTYDLVHIQKPPCERRYFVSLGDPALLGAIPERSVIRELAYRHPIITAECRRSQTALPTLNGPGRVWFTGSYFGDGFHEDAIAASHDVVDRLEATA